MRIDYIQRFNDDLNMTLDHAREVLAQKREEVRRLETFIHVVGQMAALEGTRLSIPTEDVPAFLLRTADTADAVAQAIGEAA